MQKYFKELDGEKATNIYYMVLREVEQPLLETVMKGFALMDANQSPCQTVTWANLIANPIPIMNHFSPVQRDK